MLQYEDGNEITVNCIPQTTQTSNATTQFVSCLARRHFGCLICNEGIVKPAIILRRLIY